MNPTRITSRLMLLVIAVLATIGVGTAQAALRWSGLKLIDRRQPFSYPATVTGVSCPTGQFCLAVGTQGTVVSATPSGTPNVTRNGVDNFGSLQDVSCPTIALCFVIDYTSVLYTRNPTAPKPLFTKVSLKVPQGQFETIECPTLSLCVVRASNGSVWTSTRPTGPASSWRSTTLATFPWYLNAVGCAPGGQLCVASLSGIGGANPQLATTTNPTGPASAWTVAPSPSTSAVQFISCPWTGMCVGTSITEMLSSDNPAAGGSSWTASQVVTPSTGTLDGVDCTYTTPASCVATVSDGSVVVGSGTAAAPTWTRSAVILPRASGASMACFPQGTGANCLAPVAGGRIARILAPPVPAAPTATVSGTGGLTAIKDLSCPSASLCVGVDGLAGGVMRTARPAGPGSAWSRTVQSAVAQNSPEAQFGLTGLNSVSCPTAHFCVATGPQNKLLTTTTPGTAAQWRVTTLPFIISDNAGDFPEGLGPIWCTSTTMCVTTGDSNRLFVSTRPAGGANTWVPFSVGAFNNDTWNSVACRNRTLCIAGDPVNGRLAVSTAPTQAWRQFTLLTGGTHAPSITAVGCNRDRGVCLVGTRTGALWNSTHPARGRSAFRRIKLSSRAIVGIACRNQRLCLAIDQLGRVFWSTNPTGGLSTWSHKTLDSGNWPLGARLTTIACVPGGACVAGDAGGRVYTAP
jgi:hypothetical protein